MPLSEDSLKTLPVLKQHLRLEREMGKRVFPASPEGDERSELKVAEKGELEPERSFFLFVIHLTLFMFLVSLAICFHI